jgi:pyruvate dehydrogenase E2 component (dihydrolipoamide acetyltransferase)
MDDLRPLMGQMLEVCVPDIGDFREIPIIEILVAPGVRIAPGDAIIVLESDKATIEVPASCAGTVRELRVQPGDRVSQGSILLLLESETMTPAKAPPAMAVPVEISATTIAVPPPPPEVLRSATAHASPLARRFARELGIDLARVAGSGPRGRIVEKDLQDFVKAAVQARPAVEPGIGLGLLPWPQVDFAKFGPIERAPLSKIQKISGANLSRNSIIIPHVTNFDEADITELENFRVEINAGGGAKLTMLAFMIKAAVTALRQHKRFNASLDGEDLVLKHYFNIGFAADTPNGLVVPVIKAADAKGLTEIAAEASELAAQAREGKLKPADMQGGCITISSLGGIGGLGFTPIINAPEVAIIGAARAKMAPVWDGASFGPRLMMPVSLSWDHRVADGAEAARFLVTFTGLLADFRRVSL